MFREYNFWPMYYGDDAPDEVTPLNLVTLAFVAYDNFDNITNLLGTEAGTNLNVGDLLVYRSFDWEDVQFFNLTVENMFFFNFSSTSTWLALNWGINGFVNEFFGNQNIYRKVMERVDITLK